MYLDHLGLIVQKDFDGGDSLHRAGSFELVHSIAARKNIQVIHRAGHSLPTPWLTAQRLYEVCPGLYVRHPDKGKWYSNPDTTSRDQLVPAIIALGMSGMRRELWRLEWQIIKRGLFAQNIYRNWDDPLTQKRKLPDTFLFCIPILIRAWGWRAFPFYPALLFLDFVDVLGQIVESIPIHVTDDREVRRKQPDDVDDMNGINKHLLALAVLPTPFSWLSRKIYSKFRMKNLGNTKKGEVNHVMGALVWYNRNDEGGSGNPEMAEIYRPLIEKYFS